jgi:hypothetical protein
MTTTVAQRFSCAFGRCRDRDGDLASMRGTVEDKDVACRRDDRQHPGLHRQDGDEVATKIRRTGAGGTDEMPRPGRPRSFPAAKIAEVKALACELPALR